MSSRISPLKITPEDMEELDSKTRNGLGPLLDAINVFAQQTVQAVNSHADERLVSVSLQVDAVVAGSFPIVFKHGLSVRPSVVLLANITPKDPDHVLTTPFVLNGWSLTDAGLLSVSWVTGLLPGNSYSMSFLVR